MTSPDPEVVASPQFQQLRDQFDAGLGSFQKLALDLFKKTKGLEREAAELRLRTTFNTHFHKLIESKASIEVIRMPSTKDIELVKELGGHQILTAQAWKHILNAAAAPPNSASDTNNTMHATILNNLAAYLRLTPTEFKTELNARFALPADQQTRNSFTNAFTLLNISTVIDNLELFILTVSDKITTLIYENYAKRQREKEATERIRAELKAQEILQTTTTVNDILDKEDVMSSPKMVDFINSQVTKGISNYVKNSKGQTGSGTNTTTIPNNNTKNKKQKNKKPNNQHDHPPNPPNNNTRNDNIPNKQITTTTPPSQTTTFTPNNGNKRSLYRKPIPNPYNQNQRRRYNPPSRPYSYNNNNNYNRDNEREKERERDYHADQHRRRNENYRR